MMKVSSGGLPEAGVSETQKKQGWCRRSPCKPCRPEVDIRVLGSPHPALRIDDFHRQSLDKVHAFPMNNTLSVS